SLHRIPYQFCIFMQDGSARPFNAKKPAFEPRRRPFHGSQKWVRTAADECHGYASSARHAGFNSW
ncbi:hypothetical protein, partial [Cupriavidus sp. UYPR2.512]|uniref:hypothetical protein n=1 Tax=Cupriavidus sp. UYPR2.512 TaxID=1080187 RepID=UPI001E515128